MEFTKELLEKAKSAESAEALLALAKENNYEMTAEEAEAYFAQMHKSGELSDEELENVSGGGCRKNGHLVVSVLYSCEQWRCKDHPGDGYVLLSSPGPDHLHGCRRCGKVVYCKNCNYCKYEKGLWLCYNPKK